MKTFRLFWPPRGKHWQKVSKFPFFLYRHHLHCFALLIISSGLLITQPTSLLGFVAPFLSLLSSLSSQIKSKSFWHWVEYWNNSSRAMISSLISDIGLEFTICWESKHQRLWNLNDLHSLEPSGVEGTPGNINKTITMQQDSNVPNQISVSPGPRDCECGES